MVDSGPHRYGPVLPNILRLVSRPRLFAVKAGRIRTLDPERPEVECLAVRGDRIEAIGSVEEVSALVGPTEWLDLRPSTILPGMSDSHIHLLEWSLDRKRPNLSNVRSMREALELIGEAARSAPPDDWLEFKAWNPIWRREAELPDLDAASEGRAVTLVASDLHSGWLNSEAMRRLQIAAERADPPGGEVERDTNGRPTGILKERALDWWYQGRPVAGSRQRREALREAQSALNGLGVTAVHSVEAPDSFQIVQDLERAGDLRLRVLHHMPQRFLDALIECGIRSGFGSDWLRIGGIKYFTDGALGSLTAWMLDPYEGSDNRGIRRLTPEELSYDVERAVGAGLAATIHAIGDAAVRMTLDTLERAGSNDLALRHRVEHLQCVHRDDMDRAGNAGVVGSMQPSHMLTDVRLAEERWGSNRCRGAYAFRSLLEAGTVLAFGSDAPVETPDPREGFYAAIARRDRDGYPEDGWYVEERLSSQEVLEAYTVGPAIAAGDSDRRGRLKPGYLADFAAWDTDLVTSEPETVLSSNVIATFVGGESVYEA